MLLCPEEGYKTCATVNTQFFAIKTPVAVRY